MVKTINDTVHRSHEGATGPIVYFGSMHDTNVYPCRVRVPASSSSSSGPADPGAQPGSSAIAFQDNAARTAEAQLRLHGENGQWIENVVMEPHQTEDAFWDAYEKRYKTLLTSAASFLQKTEAPPEKVIVFLRCASYLTCVYARR